MKIYDLIFSNQAKHRLSRHLLFWIVWWLFFEFTFFLPVYWYPGWNTVKLPEPVVESGYLSFILLVICNTFLAITIHIFFTYALISFITPRWLLREKFVAFTIGVIVLLMVSIALYYFEFKYGNPYIRHLFNRTPKAWTHKELFVCAWNMVLFNCPVVGGTALGIKLVKLWWLKQKEKQQLQTAMSAAELHLLKTQIHPHFLFNTLNNIYSFTLNSSNQAPLIIKKLSGILHYIIHECDQPTVFLEKELKMIQDYMDLERVRYGEQMDMQIDISGKIAGHLVAPLLLIPFVENSFKHGTSKMLSRPWVNLNIIIEDNVLYFMLTNSKPEEYISPATNKGIGILNVKRRLELLYPGCHELKMTEEADHYTVLLEIKLQAPAEKSEPADKKNRHEMV